MDQNSDGFVRLQSQRRDFRYNFDGIAVFPQRDEGVVHAYLQIFRSGILEAVNASSMYPAEGGDKFIRSTNVEPILLSHTKKYLGLLDENGVSGPIAIFITLAGVQGYRVLPETRNRSWHGGFGHPIDRDLLLLPKVVADSSGLDVAQLLRPVFDAMWNAAGWEASRNYDDDGSYYREWD